MKKLEIVNKVNSYMILFFVVIFLSEILHQYIGEKMIKICIYILIILGVIATVLNILLIIRDIRNRKYAERATKAWKTLRRMQEEMLYIIWK